MAARNPGPVLNQAPLGFPSYKRLNCKDWLARRAFCDSEVNTRVYQNVFENLGYRGATPINHIVGKNRMHLRCISGGYAHGVYKATRMARMHFYQARREGWMRKYGLRMTLFR
eukprot:GDKI01023411.1.p2 GENE.GDKI01023411.1~~GDKI01023411.1.p2  ORF type:complete len:113 (-),score=9.17 GDKI01023411.1:124-462(-)